MLNRYNPLVRLVCFVLAAVVLYQLSRLLRPRDQALAAFHPSAIQLRSFSPDTNFLPSEVEARIEKIKESQVLGQIIKPPKAVPALLGIAGRDVFIRAPDGQTGMVQEGEEVGGVKLLRVGTNRVLIQYEGNTNELTVFEGFGSESLLQKEK
jgi:hypothetical protein